MADLTVGLPPGSRIHETWDQQTHLAADAVDLLNRQVWLQQIATAVALDKKDRKVLKSPPALLDRPGIKRKKEKPKFTDTKELKRLLGPRKAEPTAEETKMMRQVQAINALRSLAT